jgi:dihydroorotase
MRRIFLGCAAALTITAASAQAPANLPTYDLLLRGGHVIDARNNIDAVMDVAIKDGKIARVARGLNTRDAIKTIDVAGLYVTPGLIDLHVHVYAGTGERGSYAGDLSVYPDGFTFRSGVTTVVDAGSSGWRNFADFKDRVIDRSKTRVLAMLNIVGNGMRGGRYEQNTEDMDGAATALVAEKFPGTVVGIKTAHYNGNDWIAVDQAVIAAGRANLPVMVDFGGDRPARPLRDLLTVKLRPGDIYTHMYSNLRQEQDKVTLGPQSGMIEGRKRGILFDAGTGGGSFRWALAVPFFKQGFKPDSLSTDLHVDSMNSSTKNLAEVGSKMMAVGLTLQEVVAGMTAAPARQIKRLDLGNLGVGSVADVAVFKLETGRFGFLDMDNTRLDGTRRLTTELTLKDGKIVYDLNGRQALRWDEPQGDVSNDNRWTSWPRPRPPAPPAR